MKRKTSRTLVAWMTLIVWRVRRNGFGVWIMKTADSFGRIRRLIERYKALISENLGVVLDAIKSNFSKATPSIS